MRDSLRTNRVTRRDALGSIGGAGVAALAGCLGDPGLLERGSDDEDAGSDDEDAGTVGPPTGDRSLPREYATDELDDAMLSGGPDKDGIPSIDEPKFAPADDPPTFLSDDDPVFGVERNGDAKAYPQYVLVWHEIVNDVVGGESVAVTYCPLTGTAQGFFRGGTELGVSGRLINSNLVMYDRATDTWWPQLPALGIRGPHEGAFLEEFQVIWTTWGRWREQHPETAVLTEDTGYVRNYGDDPYGAYDPRRGYYESDDTMFPSLSTDDRFRAKEVVIGARNADGSVAVPKAAVRDRGVVEGTVSDTPYVTVYDEALDTAYVYRNPEDEPVESDEDGIVVGGDAYDPEALPLEREIGFDAMWFAWSGYYPSTEVHE